MKQMDSRRPTWRISPIMLALAVCLAAMAGTAMPATAEEEIPVVLEGSPMDFQEAAPVIEQDRTLVPFREMAEAIDVTVRWDADNREITAEGQEQELVMTVGDREAELNGETTHMPLAPILREGRTMIPLRFFGETFGVTVEYRDHTVYLSAEEEVEKTEGFAGELSAFYAHGTTERSSWTELMGAPYPEVGEKDRRDLFSAVYLGWYELSGEGELTHEGTDHGFRRPEGYETVLETLEETGTEAMLTIFAEASGDETPSFLNREETRESLAHRIAEEVQEEGFAGVNLDIEALGEDGMDGTQLEGIRSGYVDFIHQVADKLPEDKSLVVTVPPPNSVYQGYDYERLAKEADQLVVMAYDYHDRQQPSPTAPIHRVEEGVKQLTQQVPGHQVVLGVRFPAVRYREMDPEAAPETPADQEVDSPDLEPDPVEETATQQQWEISHPFLDSVRSMMEEEGLTRSWDEEAGVGRLTFHDEQGRSNVIYLECEQSLAEKWALIDRYNLRGAAFWRLGAVPDFVYNQAGDMFVPPEE